MNHNSSCQNLSYYIKKCFLTCKRMQLSTLFPRMGGYYHILFRWGRGYIYPPHLIFEPLEGGARFCVTLDLRSWNWYWLGHVNRPKKIVINSFLYSKNRVQIPSLNLHLLGLLCWPQITFPPFINIWTFLTNIWWKFDVKSVTSYQVMVLYLDFVNAQRSF